MFMYEDNASVTTHQQALLVPWWLTSARVPSGANVSKRSILADVMKPLTMFNGFKGIVYLCNWLGYFGDSHLFLTFMELDVREASAMQRHLHKFVRNLHFLNLSF